MIEQTFFNDSANVFNNSTNDLNVPDPARRRRSERLPEGEQSSYSLPGDAHPTIRLDHHRPGFVFEEIYCWQAYISGTFLLLASLYFMYDFYC